ncbi:MULTISPECIES: Crp/Fnr family transcriptional regulator [Novilysobacter]|uniref:Crp/Fnr family transcriptional regulator n=1 Tax=Novilysobacter TaxID=3382699 RepID=UPI002EDB3D13
MEHHDDFAELTGLLQGLAALPASELAWLHNHSRTRTYASGEALIDVGAKPSQFWFLASGFLRFFYVTSGGREYNKAFARPGEIVAPLSAMLSGAPNGFVIAAIAPVRVLAYPVALLPELYERHPGWERVGRVLAEQMAVRKEARERELLLDTALVRFGRFADRYPELVQWIPQRQIASYIGVTEQALSRLLRDWRTSRPT